MNPKYKKIPRIESNCEDVYSTSSNYLRLAFYSNCLGLSKEILTIREIGTCRRKLEFIFNVCQEIRLVCFVYL